MCLRGADGADRSHVHARQPVVDASDAPAPRRVGPLAVTASHLFSSLLGGGGVDAAAAAGGIGSALDLKNILGGAGGGAILTGIIGAVMNAMKK